MLNVPLCKKKKKTCLFLMVGMQRDLETDDASLQNTLLTYDHGFVVAVLRSMRSSEL